MSISAHQLNTEAGEPILVLRPPAARSYLFTAARNLLAACLVENLFLPIR